LKTLTIKYKDEILIENIEFSYVSINPTNRENRGRYHSIVNNATSGECILNMTSKPSHIKINNSGAMMVCFHLCKEKMHTIPGKELWVSNYCKVHRMLNYIMNSK